MSRLIEAARTCLHVALRRVLSVPARIRRLVVSGVVVVAVLAAAVTVFARDFIDWGIGLIYQNAVPPDDGEMAVTVTPYPSSAEVVSIIGGKGEGLNCSVPWWVRPIFPGDTVGGRRAPVVQRFRQACVFHDLCYRHGLATYGYTQADCDLLLQEQAMRICLNAFGKEEKCQLDAKKLLAGVSHGGFNAYQSWRTSTYFEFDPYPYTSALFRAARVIDHPFKAHDPTATKNDPEQLLLTFDVARAGTTVACRNCPQRQFSPRELHAAKILEPDKAPTAAPAPKALPVTTGQPSGPAPKFSVAAIGKAIADLVRPRVDQPRPVGLPPSGVHAAPHVLKGASGQEFLVWLNRQKFENTIACVVIADPKNLMTHTRPHDAACVPNANHRMRVASADIYTSSPQPMILAATVTGQPGPLITGAGLSLARRMRACVSTDLLTTVPPGLTPNCYELQEAVDRFVPADLGAFQNFPIIKGERQIHLSRPVFDDKRSPNFAAAGHALVFDLDHRHLVPGAVKPPRVNLVLHRHFEIPDDYDPLLPLTKDKNDLRLVSLRALDGRIRIYEIDLEAERPQPVPIPIEVNGRPLALDASWGRRPVLVIEPRTGSDEAPKTRFVLSRSVVTTPADQGNKIDSARFEFLVLERARSAHAPTPLRATRGLECKVTYTLPAASSPACRRSSVQAGEKSASPAQMMQGAQLVVGRLKRGTSPGEHDIALIDACHPDRPIVLHPAAMVAADQVAAFSPVEDARVAQRAPNKKVQIRREIECRPLAGTERLAQAMPSDAN